jgi:hypothetical protein
MAKRPKAFNPLAKPFTFLKLWLLPITPIPILSPPKVAYARSALAETYSRLAVKPGIPQTSKIASWREARSWYQKSLDTWLLLKQKTPLGKFDAAQPDKIAIEIAKCDATLANLNASIP